jgi:hypothetical protein
LCRGVDVCRQAGWCLDVLNLFPEQFIIRFLDTIFCHEVHFVADEFFEFVAQVNDLDADGFFEVDDDLHGAEHAYAAEAVF